MRKIFLTAGAAGFLTLGLVASAPAEETISLPKQSWSFDGAFGTFDRESAQRGFQVYHDICATCHSLSLVSYRNLEELGFSADQVKAIAAEKQVADIDDNGQPVQRPARPSDRFVAPYANEKAARAVYNAVPPDLSVIVRAREDGENYLFGLLTGYGTPPADFKAPDSTLNYNRYFPGHMIAMPPPLAEGGITYADGTAATVEQQAFDIVNFLEWAAEPNLEARHRTGLKAILFLIATTLVLYAAKRRIWSAVHKDEH
jgi:ubiquinol-cytochrome c reductase cytochrome c1 subunit